MDASRAAGVEATWRDDGDLCLGSGDSLRDEQTVVLVRSKSYVRGPLVARMLEHAGARVVNRAGAASRCADKLATLTALHDAGLPAVPFSLVLTRADLDRAVERLGLPLVLKPTHGGFGRRVLLVRQADLVHAVYDYVEHHGHGFDRALIAQPLVRGADVRAIAVHGRVVAAVERTPTGDWRANVAAGAAARVRVPDERLTDLAVRVSDLLDLDLGGIDLFATESGYLVSEVNHVPEFRAATAATGVDIAAEIVAATLGSAS